MWQGLGPRSVKLGCWLGAGLGAWHGGQWINNGGHAQFLIQVTHVLLQHPVWASLIFFRWLSRWPRMPVGIQVVIALSTSQADRVFLMRSLLLAKVPHLLALKGKLSELFFCAFSCFTLLLPSPKAPIIEVLYVPFQVIGLKYGHFFCTSNSWMCCSTNMSLTSSHVIACVATYSQVTWEAKGIHWLRSRMIAAVSRLCVWTCPQYRVAAEWSCQYCSRTAIQDYTAGLWMQISW